MSIDHSQELQNGTSPSNKIMVLFGSETGTAEEYAFDLGNALQAEGYACEVSDLDDYDASALVTEHLAIIVSSTYGNGEAPYNAEDLYNWLETQEPDLSSLSFAVCALGDSGYPSFAQAGKDFDRLLGENGANRILERTELDACFDEQVEPFIEKVQAWLVLHGQCYKKTVNLNPV